jgi:hypothetical protein
MKPSQPRCDTNENPVEPMLCTIGQNVFHYIHLYITMSQEFSPSSALGALTCVTADSHIRTLMSAGSDLSPRESPFAAHPFFDPSCPRKGTKPRRHRRRFLDGTRVREKEPPMIPKIRTPGFSVIHGGLLMQLQPGRGPFSGPARQDHLFRFSPALLQ